MVYIRGNAYDYDQWAALGCDGWSYEDVLPYFKKSEGNERGGNDFHGGGEIGGDDVGYIRKISDLRSVAEQRERTTGEIGYWPTTF